MFILMWGEQGVDSFRILRNQGVAEASVLVKLCEI